MHVICNLGTVGSIPTRGSMSRSYKKNISFSSATRAKKDYVDFANKKRRKEGLPLFKEHWRYQRQTLQDYIDFVESHFRVGTYNIFYEKDYKQYLTWLDGREETKDLIREYAVKLYRRDKAK